jgi:hypothetical protein
VLERLLLRLIPLVKSLIDRPSSPGALAFRLVSASAGCPVIVIRVTTEASDWRTGRQPGRSTDAPLITVSSLAPAMFPRPVRGLAQSPI